MVAERRLAERVRLHLPRVRAGDVRLVIRIAVAGTIAWWLCRQLGAPKPLFGVLVPLVSMLGDPYGALNVSLSRILGVFVGVLLGIGLLALSLDSSTLEVAILLVAGLALGLLIRVAQAVNTQIAISALVMLYIGSGKAETIAFARVWETAVGAGVSLIASVLLWPPDPLAETRRRLRELVEWTREDLLLAADLLEGRRAGEAAELLEDVRDRSRRAVATVLDLERGERALRLNPLRRRDRPAYATERRKVALAARTHRHVRALMRYVADADEAAGGPGALADATRTLADATTAALADDAGRARALLERADAELARCAPVSPSEHGVAGQLRQLAVDLEPAAPQPG